MSASSSKSSAAVRPDSMRTEVACRLAIDEVTGPHREHSDPYVSLYYSGVFGAKTASIGAWWLNFFTRRKSCRYLQSTTSSKCDAKM